MLGVERHLLDEAQLVVALDAPGEQLAGLVVVETTHQHGVDLDRPEARSSRGLEAGDDVVQAVATCHLVERVRPDGVEADVDAIEAGVGQRLGRAGEAQSVGRDGQLEGRIDGARTSDDVDQTTSYEWLTPGEPHLAHPEPLGGDTHQADDLVVTEDVVVRQPFEPFGWHAIAASEVASVGQRDTKIRGETPESVEEREDLHAATLRVDG